MNRLGIGIGNPAGAFRSIRFLSKNLSLMDLRKRPGLKDSLGPVDKTEGQSLFEQHIEETGLEEQDLRRIARNYKRNGFVVGFVASVTILGSLMAGLADQGLLSFSLAVVTPVLIVLCFQNFLRAAQVRCRRYLSGFEYLKTLRGRYPNRSR